MISKEEYDELYNKMKKYKKLAKEYKEKYERNVRIDTTNNKYTQK
jgi:hypothetical protein